jgi:hypothetical protein
MELFDIHQPIFHEEKEGRDIAPISVRSVRFYKFEHGKKLLGSEAFWNGFDSSIR